MSKYKRGDQVVIGGNLIATIVRYDEASGNITYSHPVGGSTNTVYARISHTTVEPYAKTVARHSSPVDTDELPAEKPKAPKK